MLASVIEQSRMTKRAFSDSLEQIFTASTIDVNCVVFITALAFFACDLMEDLLVEEQSNGDACTAVLGLKVVCTPITSYY